MMGLSGEQLEMARTQIIARNKAARPTRPCWLAWRSAWCAGWSRAWRWAPAAVRSARSSSSPACAASSSARIARPRSSWAATPSSRSKRRPARRGGLLQLGRPDPRRRQAATRRHCGRGQGQRSRPPVAVRHVQDGAGVLDDPQGFRRPREQSLEGLLRESCAAFSASSPTRNNRSARS